MMQQLHSFSDAAKALEAYYPSRVGRPWYDQEHMRQLMSFLGNPQDRVQVVHIAGTSGKTSTCYYAAALVKAAGLKVGLMVSPHVDKITERFQINLEPLSEKEYCADLGEFLVLVEQSGTRPLYFEVLVAFAFWEFARRQVDVAVMEVIMGGLVDPTNVITRADKLCVITDIGLDHQKHLGETLTEIAEHKAGIIQLHNAVFCYEQDDDVMSVIRRRANQKQADLHTFTSLDLPPAYDFLPLFQRRNFALAREAVQFLLRRNQQRLDEAAVLAAAHTYVPARMEITHVRGKTVIIDGAHNPQKLQAAFKSIQQQFPGQPLAVLTAFTAGRDGRVAGGIQEIVPFATHIIATSFAGPEDGPHHSVPPSEIVQAAAACGFTDVESIVDPKAAWQALLARPEPVAVVIGSFYLLNHIRPLL